MIHAQALCHRIAIIPLPIVKRLDDRRDPRYWYQLSQVLRRYGVSGRSLSKRPRLSRCGILFNIDTVATCITTGGTVINWNSGTRFYPDLRSVGMFCTGLWFTNGGMFGSLLLSNDLS